jgi:hypothetical protein
VQVADALTDLVEQARRAQRWTRITLPGNDAGFDVKLTAGRVQ